MLKFNEGVLISKTINYVLWGTETPSPIEKSIRKQYHKNQKLKNKIFKFLDKLKAE